MINKYKLLLNELKNSNLDEILNICTKLKYQLYFESNYLKVITNHNNYLIKIHNNNWIIYFNNFKKSLDYKNCNIEELLRYIEDFERNWYN